MYGEDSARNFRKRLKEIWLNFANSYLQNSDNEFLKNFGAYIEEGYSGDEQLNYVFNEPSHATKQQVMLMEMLDFEAMRLPSMKNKGYALIGKTNFNKLEFIKNYFMARGLSEFAGKRKGGHYSVVDCSEIKRYDSFINRLKKYKDVPYVIFNNCDSLLKHAYVLQAIKILAEDSFIGLSTFSRDSKVENFNTDSYYIFLGEENTLHFAVDNEISHGNGCIAWDHFDAFITYIHVYDFEKGEQYFDRDFTVTYNDSGYTVTYNPGLML